MVQTDMASGSKPAFPLACFWDLAAVYIIACQVCQMCAAHKIFSLAFYHSPFCLPACLPLFLHVPTPRWVLFSPIPQQTLPLSLPQCNFSEARLSMGLRTSPSLHFILPALPILLCLQKEGKFPLPDPRLSTLVMRHELQEQAEPSLPCLSRTIRNNDIF